MFRYLRTPSNMRRSGKRRSSASSSASVDIEMHENPMNLQPHHHNATESSDPQNPTYRANRKPEENSATASSENRPPRHHFHILLFGIPGKNILLLG